MEFAYVLTNEAFPGYAKIGRTNSPRQRLSTYNTGCPHRSYRYAVCVPVGDAGAAESAAARLLRGYAIPGTEWFHVHPTDAVALLARLPTWKKQNDPTH